MPIPTNATPQLDLHPALHNFHVDVSMFGAVGDGVADDTAAIQASVDACEANLIAGKYRGGTVFFPPGQYLISDTLTITPDGPSNFGSISFEGGGGLHACTIKWDPGVPAPMLGMVRIGGIASIAAGQNSGAKFEGILFDGSDVATRGIYLTDVILMTFSRLSFVDFAVGTGNAACIYGDIQNSGCLLNTIEMCWFGRGGLCDNKGINFDNGHGNWIVRNEFGGTVNGSVRLSGGDGNYVMMNDFEGLITNGTYSVELGPNRGTVIGYNRFEDLGFSPNNTARSLRINAGGITVIGNDFGEAGGGVYQIEILPTNFDISFIHNKYTNSGSTANIKIASGCNNIHSISEGNVGPNHIEDNSTGGLGLSGIQLATNGYERGFKTLTINKQVLGPAPLAQAPRAHLDVWGQVYTEGVKTLHKAGTPTDPDFTFPADGMLAVDSSASKIWARIGGTWKGSPIPLSTDSNVVIRGPSPWVDVKAYGAVGNDVTDDTAAITSAIAAAGAGGQVFFPPGTYRVGSIAPLDGQLWTGSASNQSILKAKAGATEAVLMTGMVRNKFVDLTFNGNGQVSKGFVMKPSTVRGSRSHYFEKCRFNFSTVGLSIETNTVTQADKNTYVSCDFEDNVTACRINTVNGQEQLFLGCAFASQTVGLQLSQGTATLLGGQFGTSINTHILLDGAAIWLNLRDIICEGGPCDIKGVGSWTSAAVLAEHCVFQGTTDTVLMGSSGGIFIARYCVFNTGGVNSTANDTIFIDEFNTFGFGAAYEASGVNCIHHKLDGRGWHLNGPDFNTWGTRMGLELGNPGTAAMDVNLYRAAADILKTDDALHVADRVSVGTTSPISSPAKLYVLSTDAGVGFGVDKTSSVAANNFTQRRARDANADLVNNDVVARWDVWARNQGGYSYPQALLGQIDFAVDGTPGTTYIPGRFQLYLGNTSGSGGAREVLRVDSAGKVWFDSGVAVDTNLYRSAANELKTDDGFRVGGAFLTVAGDDLYILGTNARLRLGAAGTTYFQFVTDSVISVNAAGAGLQFTENGTTDLAAGAANTARLYSRDNGAGKTQLVARFNSGAVQVIATEP